VQLKSLALIGLAAAIGWIWLKGLHLDDIQQILVKTSDVVSTAPQVGLPGAPAPAPLPSWTPGNGDTIKIASFNIEIFGDAKAQKPYVIDELAKIVSRFDVVAIQEIRTQDNLFMQKFCQRIYQLTQRTYDYRVSDRLGNTRQTEQYAYLFDTSRVQVHPTYVYTLRDPDNLLHREPYVAMFAVRGVDPNHRFTFVLMNVHTDPDVAGDEMNVLAQAYDTVRRNAMGEDDIIMLGDFNTNVPSAGPSALGRESRPLTARDLFGLGMIEGIYPVVQNEPTNTLRTRLHDNILFDGRRTAEFRRGGVYDIAALHGLRQDQVAEISDHLPVWAEFTVTEADLPGRVAGGGVVGAR
jgi:deoxyribonuclease-1-like protein